MPTIFSHVVVPVELNVHQLLTSWSMSILRFFKPSSTLPTPQDTGLGERATESANTAVQSAMETCSSSKKRKSYTAISDKMRAAIGRYAAKNGNAAALRKFRFEITDLGECRVHLFKKQYLEEILPA